MINQFFNHRRLTSEELGKARHIAVTSLWTDARENALNKIFAHIAATEILLASTRTNKRSQPMPKQIPGQALDQFYLPIDLRDRVRKCAFNLRRSKADLYREGAEMVLEKYANEGEKK